MNTKSAKLHRQHQLLFGCSIAVVFVVISAMHVVQTDMLKSAEPDEQLHETIAAHSAIMDTLEERSSVEIESLFEPRAHVTNCDDSNVIGEGILGTVSINLKPVNDQFTPLAIEVDNVIQELGYEMNEYNDIRDLTDLTDRHEKGVEEDRSTYSSVSYVHPSTDFQVDLEFSDIPSEETALTVFLSSQCIRNSATDQPLPHLFEYPFHSDR